jgi:hypothetical protein
MIIILKKTCLLLLLSTFVFTTISCNQKESKEDEDSTENGDDDDEDNVDPNSPAKSDAKGFGTLDLSGEPGIIIAKDIEGNLKIAEIDEDGNFDIGLDGNQSYSVSVVTGALALESSGLWITESDSKVLPLISKSLGMDTIPTSNMKKDTEVDFGTITMDGDSAASDVMEKGSADGLEDLGIDEGLAEFVGDNDDNAVVSNQFDVDNNGVLDFSEDLFLLVSLGYDWRENFDADVDLNLDSVKNKFLDADTYLTKEFQAYGFLTFRVPESAISADSGTLSFPSVKICEIVDDEEVCTAKTSAEVTNKDGSDPITYGELNTSVKKLGITTRVVIDDVENPFATGEYSLEIDGRTLRVPNFSPRAVTDASSLTFPIIKVVESDGEVPKIEFKWMTRDPDATTYRATTTDELKLLFNVSERAYGLCSFGVNVDGSEVIDGVSCTLPYDTATGTINLSDCRVKDSVTLPLKWSDIATFNAGTQDAFDFTIRYFLALANK